MDIKTKYWLEENKGKIGLIGSAIGATALVGGGLFFFIHEGTYDETAGPEVILATDFLAQNKLGDIDAIDIETNKLTDSYDLPDKAHLFRSPNLDGLYFYDPATFTIKGLTVEEDKIIETNSVTIRDTTVQAQLTNVQRVLTNGNEFAVVIPEKTVVLDKSGNVLLETQKELANASEVELTPTELYVAKDTKLFNIDLNSKEVTQMDIGDKTTRIERNGKYVMARNDFGKAMGTQTVLRIKDESLHIEEVKKYSRENRMDIPVPADENQLLHITYRTDEKGEVIRRDLLTMNAVGVKTDESDELDSEETTIEMTTVAPFSEETTLASNGFLYNIDPEGGEITITEIRNGREANAVAVDTDGLHSMYVPIYEK